MQYLQILVTLSVLPMNLGENLYGRLHGDHGGSMSQSPLSLPHHTGPSRFSMVIKSRSSWNCMTSLVTRDTEI